MTSRDPAPAETPKGRARRIAAPLVALGLAAGAASVLAWRGPHVPGVSCPSRALTGLDCPGCGSTRCMAALLRGDVVGAVDQNLLAVVALPFLAWAWWAWLAGAWTDRRVTSPLDRPGASLAVLVAVVLFTVVRNVDVGIGAFLASGPG